MVMKLFFHAKLLGFPSFFYFFPPNVQEELFALAVWMLYVYPCVFCMALWSWQQLRSPEWHLMLFFRVALSWFPRAIFSKLDTFSHVRELHRQMLLPKIPSSWLSCRKTNPDVSSFLWYQSYRRTADSSIFVASWHLTAEREKNWIKT